MRAECPPYLHHLLPDVDDVQPVVEAGVAVELGGAVAQGHAQLALPLPVDVVNQLHLGMQNTNCDFLGTG